MKYFEGHIIGFRDRALFIKYNSTKQQAICQFMVSKNHPTNHLHLFITLLYLSHVAQSFPISANQDYSSREPITLEEAFLGELRPKEFTFDWLPPDDPGSDQEVYDRLIYEESGNLLLVSLLSTERRNASHSGVQPTQNNAFKNQLHVSSNFKLNTTILVSNSSALSSIDYQGYKLSPSKRYLLLWNSRLKQFRHSFNARYYLYDIKLNLISSLSTEGTMNDSFPTTSDNDDLTRFQLAEWYSTVSNDGHMIESLVLIQNNDIYRLFDVSKLNSERENRSVEMFGGSLDAAPTRLTFTGKYGIVFNGVPDWLYEEEILGGISAVQISPSSYHLAYMSFDDSKVNIMPFSIYADTVIPRVQLLRYPKAGQPNPKVTVHIIENFNHLYGDLKSKLNDIQLVLPDDLSKQQYYINRITWITNDKLGLIWSNRDQNNSFVVICSQRQTQEAKNKSDQMNKWKCEKNLQIKSENGWIDISDDILPLNEEFYLALIPKFEGSDVGEFKHIAKVSLNKSNSFVYLTSGRREVTEFNGVDYKRSLVYYTSTIVDEPGQRQLFVAELDGLSKPGAQANMTNLNGSESSNLSVCVTCDHHPGACSYNYVKMSPSTNHYVFQCAGPNVPRNELRATRRRRHRNLQGNAVDETSNRKSRDGTIDANESNATESDNSNSKSSLLWTFEDNRELLDKLESTKLMPLPLRLKIPIANTTYQAQVLLLLPPKLLENAQHLPVNKQKSMPHQLHTRSLEELMGLENSTSTNFKHQFPLVVDVYGGPGSQKVDYRFHINFGHYLASSKQIVYAMIDGRGSGYQGSKRLYELYHKLGTVEIQDQIDVTAHITRSFSFIDPMRVAIWGWSYGGYAAAMSLSRSQARAKSVSNNQTDCIETKYPTPSHGVFKCAASVAPVTNWIYYDTAYTEKYMSSPWHNELYDELYTGDHVGEPFGDGSRSSPLNKPIVRKHQSMFNRWTSLNQTSNHQKISLTQQQLTELTSKSKTNNITVPKHALDSQVKDLNDRYRRASLLDQITNIDSNRYLLMHGTADDNVNFQQSVMLIKRLIKKNILFETRLYPDQDHGIASKADKKHLGSTLSDFLAGCFGTV